MPEKHIILLRPFPTPLRLPKSYFPSYGPPTSKLSVSTGGGDGMMRKLLRMWAKSVLHAEERRRKEGRHKTSFFSPSCFLGPEWMSYVLTRVFLEATRRGHNPAEVICGAMEIMSDRQQCMSLQQMSCDVNVTLSD